MPTGRLRYTEAENQEYRACLRELEEMRIPIGCADDPRHERDWLTLEQIHNEDSMFYELPYGGVAVVVYAKLMVPRSGVLITDFEMTTPWDDVLDLSEWGTNLRGDRDFYRNRLRSPGSSGYPILSDLKKWTYWNDVVYGWPKCPPKCLNPWLTHNVPVRRRREEGVIFATGQGSIPSQYHDEMPITVKLLLRGQGRNDLWFNFGVRVDRIRHPKYRQLQQGSHASARLTEQVQIFKREERQLGAEPSASPQEFVKRRPHASGEHDETCDARTPETKRRTSAAPAQRRASTCAGEHSTVARSIAFVQERQTTDPPSTRLSDSYR